MSPENARCLLIDDDPDNDMFVRLAIQPQHKVVRTITGLEEALNAARFIKKEKINVVLVDGNLHGSAKEGQQDGEKVIDVIRTADVPDVKIVDISSLGIRRKVDARVQKWELVAKLSDVVTKL